MPTLRPNHRQIMAAKAINNRKTRYRIEGESGLWLYVSPTGTRTWYARYQIGSGATRTERWFRIGDAKATPFAVAARRAREISTAVDVEERDPHGEREYRRRDELTFGDVFDEWYKRHAKLKLARHVTDMTHYRNHIAGEFARRRIADLKRIEIARYRDKIAAKASPLVSNEVLMLINRVLYWAMDEGLIDANPAARLRRAGKSKPRDRVLSQAGIKVFWDALGAMEHMSGEHMAKGEKGRMLSPATQSVLRLLLLTGQRRSEVVEAQKSEFELDGPEPVWTIPAVRTKNGLLHRLPLCPMAAAEFRRAIKAAPAHSPFVFPSPENAEKPISAEAVTRAMARMIAELKLPRVSPHDLRRTVGTELARLGLPVHVRSLVLNHSPMSQSSYAVKSKTAL